MAGAFIRHVWGNREFAKKSDRKSSMRKDIRLWTLLSPNIWPRMLILLMMKGNTGFGSHVNMIWILSQVGSLPANSPFHLPCAIYSLSLDILPIHPGRIKYFYNESVAGDRCQIDDCGGGNLKCSRSSHWDDKEKSNVCWKIYHQAVRRPLFGLQKVV